MAKVVNPWESCYKTAKPDLAKLEAKGSISTTEKAILNLLEKKLGIKIIRQVAFPGFVLLDGVLDLVNVKLCIEFDGPKNHQSEEKRLKDDRRDAKLMSKGYSIYRFQWFEWVDRYEWGPEIERRVNESIPMIKCLIKLQILKNKQQKSEPFPAR